MRDEPFSFSFDANSAVEGEIVKFTDEFFDDDGVRRGCYGFVTEDGEDEHIFFHLSYAYLNGKNIMGPRPSANDESIRSFRHIAYKGRKVRFWISWVEKDGKQVKQAARLELL